MVVDLLQLAKVKSDLEIVCEKCRNERKVRITKTLQVSYELL